MCTLTWFRHDDGYELFMNRDETRTRLPGLPPALERSEGMRYVAPRDGDFGGTWVAANEAGLGLCLLNGFAAPGRPGETDAARSFTSRGRIVPSLMAATTLADVRERLAGEDLQRFRPFLLVGFEHGRSPFVASWSGVSLEPDHRVEPEQPLVSSSFCTDSVRRNRVELFHEMARGAPHDEPAGLHLAFHRAHVPVAGPHSPCMHRPDARTVSFSRVRVDGRSVRFHYTPDAPCRGGPEPLPVELPRRPQ